MRIPASSLLKHLTPGSFYELRASDYTGADDSLPYTDAVAMAIRGQIEAIATRSGTIKALRLLPENERQPAPELPVAEHSGGSCRPTANTLGVYRQHLREVIVGLDSGDKRVVIREGEMRGFCYAFKGLSV